MRQEIIFEIRRLAAANDGKPPGRATFEKETSIRRSAWEGKIWAKWSDAIAEAGFEPQQYTQKTDINDIFEKLAEAIRHFKCIPTKSQLMIYKRQNPDFPWHSSLEKRFRSKAEMIDALAKWVKGRPGYTDLVDLLPEEPHLQPASSDPTATTIREGYVYLIKSGDFYKIGRGDDLEKRVKQIRTALPDTATLEHAIRTDDQAGIESYWHKRFSDKRANGEWFKLSAGDVAAFKRRKSQ